MSLPHAVFKLKAYTSTLLPREVSIEEGDKIILHQSILDNLMRKLKQKIPHPIILEMRNNVTGRVSHCGVLEFSAPDPNKAFLPPWMMENMALEDGSDLQLKLKHIPKATKIKFRPVDYKFFALPDPKSILEFALSKFTALTEGDRVTVRVSSNSFELIVLEVSPAHGDFPAVCVVNTNPAVEFTEPEKQAPESKQDATFELDTPVKKSIDEKESHHYRFKIVDPHMSLTFKLTCSRGDADLYVSTQQPKPSITNFTWTTRASAKGVATIEPDHPLFSKTWYYLTVKGQGGSAAYELLAHEETPNKDKKQEQKIGKELGRADEHPDAQQCDNCRAWVPKARYMMHTLHCARNNWRCDKCQAVIRAAEKAQHMHCPEVGCTIVVTSEAELEQHRDVAHKMVECVCGSMIAPELLSAHQKKECKMRSAQCKYCQLSLPFAEVESHETYCGSKSKPCPICGKNVSAKRIPSHLAAEHRYNASLIEGMPGYKDLETLRREWRIQQEAMSGFDEMDTMEDDNDRGGAPKVPRLDDVKDASMFGYSGPVDRARARAPSSGPAPIEDDIDKPRPSVVAAGRAKVEESYKRLETDADLEAALAASKAQSQSIEDEILQAAILESARAAGVSPSEPIKDSKDNKDSKDSKGGSRGSSSSSSSSASFKPRPSSGGSGSSSSDRSPKPLAAGRGGGQPSKGLQVVKCPNCDKGWPTFDALVTHMARCQQR